MYGYLGGVHPASAYAIVAPGTLFVIPPDPGQLIIQLGTNTFTLEVYPLFEFPRSFRMVSVKVSRGGAVCPRWDDELVCMGGRITNKVPGATIT